MIVKELRITLPYSVGEYQISQLFSINEASKCETGGGEGVEIIKNEPFEDKQNGSGQYTFKVYHLSSKVPKIVKVFAPNGSLQLHEESWNAYPYCRTILTNPYLQDNFKIETISKHEEGIHTLHDNIHDLDQEMLKKREVDIVDIATDKLDPKDYKEDEDPMKFHSEKTGRGPLGENWMKKCPKLMTCYKLTIIEFKWRGLQGSMENLIFKIIRNLMLKLHRQNFCWLDKWFGMQIDDIRTLENKTKYELDVKRNDYVNNAIQQ
jgi:hypothetical protein